MEFKNRHKGLVVFLVASFILLTVTPALATTFSPAYRAKSLLTETETGYTAVTATIVLPTTEDVKGVGRYGTLTCSNEQVFC